VGAINITNFGGMLPIADDRRLPDNRSAYAENVWLHGGVLDGFRPNTLIHTNVNPNTKCVFRIPNDLTETPLVSFANSTWMEFENVYVDVLRTPVIDDQFERYYWAQPGEAPKYNTLARIQAGSPEFTLGVPAPDTAPVVVAGSAFDPEAIIEARAYVYTWVTDYGEEGPVSPPTVVNGPADALWDLTVTAPIPNDTEGRALNLTRIYRTITSSAGVATYFLVHEMDIGTLAYTDIYLDSELTGNNLLESTNWIGPPDELEGMVAMANGIFAGWMGNTLCFSEPFRPHAWPAAYQVTVDFPIVGMGVIGQSLIIGTTGKPVAATGVHPSTITLSKIESSAPCVSRGSIVSSQGSVTYASTDGLVQAKGGAVTPATAEIIDRTRWLNDVDPYDLIAVGYQGKYFALHAPRLIPALGIMIGSGEQGGFQWMDTDLAIQKIQVDPWSSEVFLVTADKVLRFDTHENSTREPYTWKSKVYHSPRFNNLGVMKVYFITPEGSPTQTTFPNNSLVQTLADNQYGLIRVYANDELVATREIRTSGEMMRLPSGFKAEYWQFEVTARVTLTDISIASSARELAGV